MIFYYGWQGLNIKKFTMKLLNQEFYRNYVGCKPSNTFKWKE